MLVSPNGSKLWRLAYRHQGNQELLALGAYPTISLRDARKARDDAKELLASGDDPARLRKMAKRRERVATGHTFRVVADEWFEGQKRRWAKSYADRLRSRLDADLMPEGPVLAIHSERIGGRLNRYTWTRVHG